MDTTKKLYFKTEADRDAYNAAEAQYRGMDMLTTIFWYPIGEDAEGFYVVITD